MLKLDLGLAIFFFMTMCFFDYGDIANTVLSCLTVCIMIVIVVWCKRAVYS